jgi:hypothetical protein
MAGRGLPAVPDDERVDQRLDAHQADVHFQLVEDHELVSNRTERLAEALAARGIELMRFPVVDIDVPVESRACSWRLDYPRTKRSR